PPHCDPRALHSFPTRRSSDLARRSTPAATEEASARRPPGMANNETSMATSDSANDPLRRADAPLRTTTNGDNAMTALKTESSTRSEEHTSELQSRENLVCRLL